MWSLCGTFQPGRGGVWRGRARGGLSPSSRCTVQHTQPTNPPITIPAPQGQAGRMASPSTRGSGRGFAEPRGVIAPFVLFLKLFPGYQRRADKGCQHTGRRTGGVRQWQPHPSLWFPLFIYLYIYCIYIYIYVYKSLLTDFLRSAFTAVIRPDGGLALR